MARPGTYVPSPKAVDRIETHASFIFLAGAFAYKIKRAVKYPFLDFSTVERRRDACLNELRVNRRTAPHLYSKVVPVTLNAGGAFRLGGEGAPVEWVLVMRRFDQRSLFDRMATEGRLELDSMNQLASEIATFHGSVDRTLTVSQAVTPLDGIITEHEILLTSLAGRFPHDDVTFVARATRESFLRLAPLLRQRASGGFLRHCHGDLHLRNIVDIEGRAVLFDALEFDDNLAIIDVLYDLAFLLMDLGKRGLDAHASAVLNGYLDDGDTGNLVGLAALPLFLSLRAMIRAKVELLRGEHAQRPDMAAVCDEVRGYFELAVQYLRADKPRLIALGGLSGSGKSAVGRSIAPQIGAFPGAVIVRSDVERKRMFGVATHESLPKQAYAPEVSEQVYTLCRKRAALILGAGRSVIVDAVHARPGERDAVAALADQFGVPFSGFWLDAQPDLMRERVATRIGDVSDATLAVVAEQLGYDLGPIAFERVDASGALDDVANRCLSRVRD